MKQTLRPSRSASGSIDYPGPRVYGQLSPDDPDDIEIPTAAGDDSICPVCQGTGTVPCAGTRDGMDYDTVEDCPNCSEPLKINGVWRRQF